MPNKVMEHNSTDEETCDDQAAQQDTRNNQVADIGIACFVAAPGLVARVVAPIHDDLYPPFDARYGVRQLAAAFLLRACSRLTCPSTALAYGQQAGLIESGSTLPRSIALGLMTDPLHLGIVKWQQRPAFQTCGESPNPNAADAEKRRPVHPVKLGTWPLVGRRR